ATRRSARCGPHCLGPGERLGGGPPTSFAPVRQGTSLQSTPPTPPRGPGSLAEVRPDHAPRPIPSGGRRPVRRVLVKGPEVPPGPGAGAASHPTRSSALSQFAEIPFEVLGRVAVRDVMLSNELEYLVQGDPRFLGGSPHRRLPLPQAIEGVVDPRLSKPAFDEPAEGLRPIRLESLREPIDFPQALFRKADGHRLSHVYDIILRIHRPFQPRCELPVWRRPTTARSEPQAKPK